MPKYKVHGYMFEPGPDNGSDKNGYIHFYDVVEADSQGEAAEIAYEDYGEYNTLEFCGTVENKSDEKAWIAQNPD